MEYTTINKETPEMKQLISGIKEMSKCLQEIAKTHRSLFRGKIYLTRREVCLRTPCRIIGTRALFPTPKSQGRYSTNSPTLIDYCKRIIEDKAFTRDVFLSV